MLKFRIYHVGKSFVNFDKSSNDIGKYMYVSPIRAFQDDQHSPPRAVIHDAPNTLKTALTLCATSV